MQRPDEVEAAKEDAMRGQGTPRGGKRQEVERDAVPPADEDADPPEERTPSFLSARELQATKPAKGTTPGGAGERTEEPSSKKR